MVVVSKKAFCLTCGGYEVVDPKLTRYMIDDNTTNACCKKCSVIYRFFKKVKKTLFGCWEWTGGSRGNGYGAMKVDGKVIDAHRLSFEIHYGKIGHSRIFVRHICDNRRCCNPNHLVVGTHSENMQDAFIRGRLPLMNKVMARKSAKDSLKVAA